MPIKPVMRMSYAKDSDEEYTPLDVYSRDIVAVERKYRDLSAEKILNEVRMETMYRVAHLVLQRRGEIDAGLTFPEFLESYQVAGIGQVPGEDGAEGEEAEGANPTSADL